MEFQPHEALLHPSYQLSPQSRFQEVLPRTRQAQKSRARSRVTLVNLEMSWVVFVNYTGIEVTTFCL